MKFHKYPQEEPEGNLYNKNNFLCKVLYSVKDEKERKVVHECELYSIRHWEEENEHSFDCLELKNLTLYELQQRVDQCVEHINNLVGEIYTRASLSELNTYLMEGYSRSCTCSDEEIEEFKRGISNGTIGNNTLYNPRTDRHLQTIRINLFSKTLNQMNNIDIKKLADDGQVFSEVLMDSPNKIGDLVLMDSDGKKFFLDIHHFFKITSDYQIEGVVGKINEDGSCRMYTTFDLAKMAECDYDLETFRLHYQLLGM